jgi:hypothetical protein
MRDEKMTEYETPQRYAICNKYADETVEALQYGRPGKNDPRKTPAKPSERRKGSKKNKPGSAKKPNTGIKVSKETEARLRKMMTEHNKKVAAKGKGSKATMGRLKSVYRRGAGAFSRSHAPNMSRGGWGIARVKAFLYLLRNGRPSNPNYKQDNDLLPKSHPRASVDEDYEDWDGETFEAAEYQGRKVNLNKPFRTPKGPKKFAVYVKNEKGTVVIVRFGDPNMEIKRDDPQRRKNFRSRHNCDSPGPKTKARYWSCKMWEKNKSVSDYTSDEDFNKTEKSMQSGMGGCGCGCSEADALQAGMEDYIFMTREGAEKKSREIGFGGAIHTEETADGITMYFPGPDDDAFQRWFDKNDSHDASENMQGRDVFDNPGEAMNRAKDVGCRGIHSHTRDGKTVFMPCRTHEEYEEKKATAYYKDDDDDEEELTGYGTGGCPTGEVMRNGRCERVAITLDVDIKVEEAIVEAETGRQAVRISGIAFHNGVNKNGWELTRKGADLAVSQMVGGDLTLNHPKSEAGRFRRNMDGGVDEAVVGIVREATVNDLQGGAWEVRFKADVFRTELFEALESGLWLRQGYGVSIGGTGIPDEVIEAADGKVIMRFESDFEYDHLAIVHRPAYVGARITEVERVNMPKSEEAFNRQTDSSPNIATETTPMSEEQIIMEASEEVVEETPDYLAEIEALKASLKEREEELSVIKAAEEAKAEEARLALVHKATEMGIAGIDALPSETLESIIASFEAKMVVEEPAEEVVEMTPVASNMGVEASEKPVAENEAVVANYLNRKLLKTPETLYATAWNAWAKGWNQTLGAAEDNMRAPTYAEAKENNLI